MFADMTKEIPYIELSGWKVAYFRVLGWEKGEEGDIINPNKAPVLEICLVPENTDVSEFKNHWKGIEETAFRIPAGAQIIRVRAGDPWPVLQDELRIARSENDELDDWVFAERTKPKSLPNKKCKCQGFYQPVDCPVHGTKTIENKD